MHRSPAALEAAGKAARSPRSPIAPSPRSPAASPPGVHRAQVAPIPIELPPSPNVVVRVNGEDVRIPSHVVRAFASSPPNSKTRPYDFLYIFDSGWGGVAMVIALANAALRPSSTSRAASQGFLRTSSKKN